MPRLAAYNRQQCLEKAMGLFWEKGFNATSLKDIEQALDMRPGSIYAAFGNKESLYGEALDCYADIMGTQFTKGTHDRENPIEGLADYVRGLGRLADSQPPSRACMLVKGLLESSAQTPALQHRIKAHLDAMESLFRQAFTNACQAGQLRDPQLPAHQPARLARRLQCEVMGLRAFAQRCDNAAELQMLADDIADGLLALMA